MIYSALQKGAHEQRRAGSGSIILTASVPTFLAQKSNLFASWRRQRTTQTNRRDNR
jgi:hypothetical protein